MRDVREQRYLLALRRWLMFRELWSLHIQSKGFLVPIISSTLLPFHSQSPVFLSLWYKRDIIVDSSYKRHTCPVANLGNKSGISSLHPLAQILFPSINPFNSGNWAHIGERLEEEAVAFSGCRCLSTSDIGVAVNMFLGPSLSVDFVVDGSGSDLKPEGLMSLVKDWMVVCCWNDELLNCNFCYMSQDNEVAYPG